MLTLTDVNLFAPEDLYSKAAHKAFSKAGFQNLGLSRDPNPARPKASTASVKTASPMSMPAYPLKLFVTAWDLMSVLQETEQMKAWSMNFGMTIIQLDQFLLPVSVDNAGA